MRLRPTQLSFAALEHLTGALPDSSADLGFTRLLDGLEHARQRRNPRHCQIAIPVRVNGAGEPLTRLSNYIQRPDIPPWQPSREQPLLRSTDFVPIASRSHGRSSKTSRLVVSSTFCSTLGGIFFCPLAQRRIQSRPRGFNFFFKLSKLCLFQRAIRISNSRNS
ncbi:hypothetical protein BD289DRAFT_243369 [Coniella lustricola]|uniref:Uncharacterized protein n=1 Tax=Coniella lustricola TaxID=2025994 RepID=A0A2T3A9G6_9PEZI|nr:hypothetical protein BD289DRAFT_243369 [Coniella lustricola]